MLRWILKETKAKFNSLHLKKMVLIVTALVLGFIFILELFKISNQILIYAITFVYFLFYLISFKSDISILLNKLFKSNQSFKKKNE
jgi:type IV secretory pathway VirB3-like protein